MRHSFMLIVSLCVAVGTAQAQQNMLAQEQSAADLAGAYQAWQQPRDTEEKISLGERVLALEPNVEAWSLPIPRQRLKAEVSAGLGALYVARARGVPADNLEKAIEFLQAAVTTWTREADPTGLGSGTQCAWHRLLAAHSRRKCRQPGDRDRPF